MYQGSLMAEEFRVLRPREFHAQLVDKGQRADGRKLRETRDLKLETDAIKTADSSSLVKFGSTSLVCGCICRLVNQGTESSEKINIKVELPPICSGPTDNKSQLTEHLLTRTLKNILYDSNCIDEQSLIVDEIDSYWSIDIEVICLNYDGSILDAALVAILSSLKRLTLTDKSKPVANRVITINSIPICLSFALIANYVISDPTSEEERIAETMFSISVDASENELCHINKLGGKAVPNKTIFDCLELTKTRAQEIKKVLDDVQTGAIMEC